MHILWYILTALICFMQMPVLAQQVINQTSFESWPDEQEFIQTNWVSDGFDPLWVQGFDQSRCFIDDSFAVDGTKALRVKYPAGGVGPVESGAQAQLMFSERNEMYFSYWLRFNSNFDWGGTSEGGKLPGFGSGENCSGGENCDGNNGFTSRLMWRSGGRAVLYLYHMDKPGTYGEDIDLIYTNGKTVYFKKGIWYQVAQRVKINTDNNANGEIEIWINGEQVLTRNNIRYVNDGSLVDNFYFATFHGGTGSQWAPAIDCFTWFDNIIVADNKNDVLIGPYTYTLTVHGGSGDGQYSAGENIVIKADTSGGRIFEKWIGDTTYIDDVYSQTTTLSMPAAYTDISASFENELTNMLMNGDFASGSISPWTFTLSDATAAAEVIDEQVYVNISEAGPDIWEPQLTQTEVDIKCGNTYTYAFDAMADAARTIVVGVNEGAPDYSSIYYDTADLTTNMLHYSYTFTAGLNDENSRFDMKFGADNNNVTVDNIVLGNVTVNNGTYALELTNGSGAGNYDEDFLVCISANEAPVGMVFDGWTGDVATVRDVNSPNTTLDMPAANISLTANYTEKAYTLTVESGSGSGTYTYGTVIDIAADAALEGQVFYAWSGDIAYVADTISTQTTFTMPATDAGIVATYTNLTGNRSSFNNFDNDFVVQFNMATKLLSIYYNGQYSMRIFDIKGMLIVNKTGLNGNSTINISTYNKGLYLLKATCDNETVTRKILLY